MSKIKRRGPDEPDRVKTTADLKEPPTAAKRSRRGGRETVDALVVAFVLAFLIRTFVAEAFVIPTGSMAPTLMGRHKDVYCDQCGVRFQVNSSDQTADAAEVWRKERGMTAEKLQRRLATLACVGGECPQCRYLMLLEDEGIGRLAPDWVAEADQTADYSGDRLVVSKYAYSFADPKRWDVAVFKYPGNSQVNYIKRVTGLPNEELRIFQGDLYTRPLDSGDDFAIASKPPEHVMAMRQFVYDTNHQPADLINAGWPVGWSGEGDGWATEQVPTTLKHDAEVIQTRHQGTAPAGETRWLRYRHLPPTENVWRRVLGEKEPITVEPQPQLITDFTPYNTELTLGHANENARKGFDFSMRPVSPNDFGRIGVHWVSDLMVEADLTIESNDASVSLDLVKAGDHYGVTISGKTGEATLWRQRFEEQEQETLASVSTDVRAGASHQLRLANIDNRLLLWVDDESIDVDAAYETPQSNAEGDACVPRTSDSDPGDLAPAGVGVSDGDVAIERLRIWRDGYYLAANAADPGPGFTSDLTKDAFNEEDRRNWELSLLEIPTNPDRWYVLANRRRVDFPIDENQLFVMGDNSGWSLDARLWSGGNGRDGGQPGGPYLERSQLVGKAICVYWPHAWYSVPGTGRRVPAWPNFEDMRLVR